MNTHLYRSRDDRMLAGVAGGLAELWDADPSVVRILWALLVIFTGGVALVVYIVMALVVPEEPEELGMPDIASTPGAAADGTNATTAAPTTAALTRIERREARRRLRASRRAARQSGPRTGPVVVGALFILFGTWFLAREYLPMLDWDWVWPATLIAIGALVLFMAVRPSSNGTTPTPPTPTAGAQQ